MSFADAGLAEGYRATGSFSWAVKTPKFQLMTPPDKSAHQVNGLAIPRPL
ncbi:MAG: hypothetical protein ING02_09560 [Roseomonas sp.]|nr:hypothetical protein [Roseomonas sp.]